MPQKTAIIYATVDGQTLKICTRLAQILREHQHAVEMVAIENFSGSLEGFEKVVIASSIRYGRHNARITDFILHNSQALAEKKGVFVSVNLVARKPERATPETNPYVKKFLGSIDWVPDKVGVFAGMLDYNRYSLSDRLLIQLIMLITRGPVRSKEPIEYTNWGEVEAFGSTISKL